MEKVFEILKELNDIEVEGSRLAWVQFTAGYDFGLEDNNEKLMAFLKSEDNFKTICDVRGEDLSEVDRRRIELAYKTFEGYHKSDEINALQLDIENLTNELAKILNVFRFKLDGREVTSVELAQILNQNDDREVRKKAYLSKNQINQPMVDAGILKLVEMRKELAKLNGFDSFVDYKLDQEDLEPEIFSNWKEQVAQLLPAMNKERLQYAQKFLGDDKIYPWDEAYIESKIAPSLSKKVDMLEYYEVISAFFEKFGYTLDDYNITYDVFSRKNKSEWGYNFPIEVAKDSRILANVKDRFHEYNVLMHETGHGVHSFLKNPDELILNRGVSGIITEGIANLFGSMIYDESFFKSFFDDDIDRARKEFDAIVKWRNLNALRRVGIIMFDQNFYRNDCQSLEDVYSMYWATFKDILGSEEGDYEPPWAYLIHHTTHPIYLHNYFMGDVTCEMLRKVFTEKHNVEKVTDMPKEFGDFLYEETIKPSGLYTYGQMFERISGEKFSLKYLL